MIYERAIREWNEVVPWKSPQMVEQDLVICRALVSIFSDDFLRVALHEQQPGILFLLFEFFPCLHS